jgi:hypothetical protein
MDEKALKAIELPTSSKTRLRVLEIESKMMRRTLVMKKKI